MSIGYWIIEFFATFIEYFMLYVFCGTFIIFNFRINEYVLKMSVLCTFAAAITMVINQIELYSVVSAIFSILIQITGVMILFREQKKVYKKIILSITYVPIIMLIDGINVSIISSTLEIPTSYIYEMFSLNRVLAIISSKFILSLLVLTLNKIMQRQMVISKKIYAVIFIISSLMTIIILLVTFIDIKNESVNSHISVLLYSSLLILLMIVFLGSLKLGEYYEYQQQTKLIKVQNEMLKKSMDESEKTFQLWKSSLHNHKHNIINLMMLAENNDISSIKKELIKENELLGRKLFYYKTGNETVDTVLAIKQNIAESMGITFMINASVPNDIPLSANDLTSLLGNILDNAIEASIKEEKPYIEVNTKRKDETLFISVSNKCTIKNISLQTTKNEGILHGIGISSVKKIVNEYNGDYSFNQSGEVFFVNIIIPLKTSDK